MRKVFAVALMIAMVGALGFSQSAEAGVTYDFVFRSTDSNGNPIAGGSVVGGGLSFSFTSTAAANAAQGVVLDIFMVSSEFGLEAGGTSVGWDDSSGLSIGSAKAWSGHGVSFNAMGNPNYFMLPIGGVNCGQNLCSSFNGVVLPPNGPPSLPSGVYQLGTIVWDTSALGASSAVMTTIVSGIDGTGALDPGGNRFVPGETTFMGFINIVPEPATAGLLGLGLAGLVLAGRRRRA